MDYSFLGLNQRMQKTGSLPDRYRPVSGVEFEGKYEVQAGNLNTSKVNLGEFIKLSVGGSVMGTFNLSQALDLTSTITYVTPKSKNPTFGHPIVGIYQGAGTAAANQIYPVRGGSVTLGRYDILGGQRDYSYYNGTSDHWRATVIDTNGTSGQAVTFIANWIFTDYVTDNVS